MAAITATSMTGTGEREVTITTLGASDTLTYNKGAVLYLNNVTAGALTPNIDGAGGSTVPVKGVGAVDVSGGYTTGSIAAGEVFAIPLDSIFEYLQGVITITGGDAMKASLLEF